MHLTAYGILATQRCPCGCRTDPRRQCRCSTNDVQRYIGRLSGPLLDRIDIHVDVPALSFGELTDSQISGPTTEEVRAQVLAARERQRARNNGGPVRYNAHLDSKTLRHYCKLNDASKSLLERALNALGLSARAYDKILRIARTLADLEDQDDITEHHVAEAVQYRSLDKSVL